MGLSMTRFMKMLAALTLLIAAFVVVPSADAATCVPEIRSAHQALDHPQSGGDHSETGAEHGTCSHGHCHSAASARTAVVDYSASVHPVRVAHDLPRDDVAVSHPSDGLKRPPRA